METNDLIHIINELGEYRTRDGFKSMLMFITPDGKHVGFANNLADSPCASLAMLKACVSDVMNHSQLSEETIQSFQRDIEEICQKKIETSKETREVSSGDNEVPKHV